MSRSLPGLHWLLPALALAWVQTAGAEVGSSTPRVVPLSQVDDGLDQVLTDAGLPTAEELRDDYRIVFVPGILGSGLEVAGQAIWGQGRPTVRALALLKPDATVAEAVVLRDYPVGVTRVAVYDDFDRRLAAIVGGAEPLEFAYDWRQGIELLADRFDKRLRSAEWLEKLHGKKVILLAHSMGGVITWAWKERYYVPANYPIKLDRVVILGSPLAGSCEMLRMLLEGYRPPKEERALGFLDQLYEWMFSALRPAAFTFQSVFDLLPADSKSCLIVEDQTGEFGLDHFEIGSWKQFLLPQLDSQPRFTFFGLKVGQSRPSTWDELGMTRMEFEELLEERLNSAREFRQGLGMTESSIEGIVRYFYSDSQDTTSQVVLSDRGRAPVLDHEEYGRGDGRVLETSVKCCLQTGDHARWVAAGHGAMVGDPSVLNAIEDLVEDAVRQIKLAAVVAEDRLRAAFASLGLLADAESVMAQVSEGTEQAVSALERLNLDTVTAAARNELADEWVEVDPGGSLLRYASRLWQADGPAETLVPVFDMALAAGGLSSEQRAQVLSWKGASLNEVGDFERAATAFQQARIEVLGPQAAPELQGRIQVGLGTALVSRGKFEQASEAFGAAVSLLAPLVEQGDPAAIRTYAWQLEHGLGVAADKQRAASFYARSAEAGDLWSAARFGELVRDDLPGLGGEWTRSVVDRAIGAHSDSARSRRLAGETAARLAVAAGRRGATADAERLYQQAFEFLSPVAEAGSPSAMVALGELLEVRPGVDPSAALDWYRKAAEAGSVEALDRLAYTYLSNGQPQQALPWLVAGREKGSVNACRSLEWMFEHGVATGTTRLEALRQLKSCRQPAGYGLWATGPKVERYPG